MLLLVSPLASAIDQLGQTTWHRNDTASVDVGDAADGPRAIIVRSYHDLDNASTDGAEAVIGSSEVALTLQATCAHSSGTGEIWVFVGGEDVLTGLSGQQVVDVRPDTASNRLVFGWNHNVTVVQGVDSADGTPDTSACNASLTSGSTATSGAINVSAGAYVDLSVMAGGNTTVSSWSDSLVQIEDDHQATTHHAAAGLFDSVAQTGKTYSATLAASQDRITSYVMSYDAGGTTTGQALTLNDSSPALGSAIVANLAEPLPGPITYIEVIETGDQISAGAGATDQSASFQTLRAMMASGVELADTDFSAFTVRVCDASSNCSGPTAFQFQVPSGYELITSDCAYASCGSTIHASGTVVGTNTLARFAGGSGTINSSGVPTYATRPAEIHASSFISGSWTSIAVTTETAVATGPRLIEKCDATPGRSMQVGYCPQLPEGRAVVNVGQAAADCQIMPRKDGTAHFAVALAGSGTPTYKQLVYSQDFGVDQASVAATAGVIAGVTFSGLNDGTDYECWAAVDKGFRADGVVRGPRSFKTNTDPGGGNPVVSWNPGAGLFTGFVYSDWLDSHQMCVEGSDADQVLKFVNVRFAYGDWQVWDKETIDGFSFADAYLERLQNCGSGNKRLFLGFDMYVTNHFAGRARGSLVEVDSISLSTPVSVTTKANHGLADGTSVYFGSVEGTTELNGSRYKITKTGAKTFTLVNTNGGNFTAYTGGGRVYLQTRGHVCTPQWAENEGGAIVGDLTGSGGSLTKSCAAQVWTEPWKSAYHDLIVEVVSRYADHPLVEGFYFKGESAFGRIAGCTPSECPTRTGWSWENIGNSLVEAFTKARLAAPKKLIAHGMNYGSQVYRDILADQITCTQPSTNCYGGGYVYPDTFLGVARLPGYNNQRKTGDYPVTSGQVYFHRDRGSVFMLGNHQNNAAKHDPEYRIGASRLMRVIADPTTTEVGYDGSLFIMPQTHAAHPANRSGNQTWNLTRYVQSYIDAAITCTITGITKANPAVVTVSSCDHPAGEPGFTDPESGFATGAWGADYYVNGERVILWVNGMTQLNGKTVVVRNLTGDEGGGTFSLEWPDGSNVNSTSFGTFTSGISRDNVLPDACPTSITDASYDCLTDEVP